MTGPAKVRHAIAAVMIGAFLAAVGVAVWWVNSKFLPRPRGGWSTQHLADPVELTAGETTFRVTRFVLDFEREALTLEQDELTFNDYGDATRTGGKEPLTLPVQLHREAENRFEIVLKSGFRQRLRLVVSPEPANTHRLIVLGKDGDRNPERVLELRAPEIVPDELGDRPQPDRFRFETLGHVTGEHRDEIYHRLYGIEVTGSLTTRGQLSIDPNYYGFGPDGSVRETTCLGWTPAEVTFKPLGPDPANRGRRAFELVPKNPHAPGRHQGQTFILVLGPTELSPHLLLIKTDGRTQQVLRLRDKNRDNHLFMLKKLDKVPADEREAFLELGKAGGRRTVVEAHDGHVTALYHLEGDVSRFDPILARFPHLRGIEFVNATLPAGGLPSLERLKDLRGIGFTLCEISDEGFASVGKATGLRRLHIFGCNGPTAAGFVHLAPLTNLEMLDIRREDVPPGGPVFDEEMKYLAGMTRLTRLNLHGHYLTDAGLAPIGRLKELRQLYLSVDQLTDDGFKHLEGLTQLEEFTVYGRYSREAMAEFRRKLPNLRKTP